MRAAPVQMQGSVAGSSSSRLPLERGSPSQPTVRSQGSVRVEERFAPIRLTALYQTQRALFEAIVDSGSLLAGALPAEHVAAAVADEVLAEADRPRRPGAHEDPSERAQPK